MDDITEDLQQQITRVHMDMVVNNCVHSCRFRKTDPPTMRLYVEQAPHMWHIRSATDPTWTALPSGTGVLAWNTALFPTVELAFQHALAERWLTA
jgi:hypothetical protein